MSERHLLALSGGKDSAALAVYMREKYPDLPLEYIFIDSGCELPETYAYLEKLEAMLNISIKKIISNKGFEYWLKFFNGVLPSPQNRWCTKYLKIKPYTKWLEKHCNDQNVINYAGLRADEDRGGYKAKSSNVMSCFPFVEDGLVLSDILNILQKSGLGLPEYYSWRQRSGCYFCFYQKDEEWRGLRKNHPDLFEKACQMEEKHSDGRQYTWREKGYLRELSEQKEIPVNNKNYYNNKLINIIEGSVRLPQKELIIYPGGESDD